jgi:hypothetical protein
VARDGQSFKDGALARLLQPERATLDLVSKEVGVPSGTLHRWNAQKGLTKGDGRPAALHPTPAHDLSKDERSKLMSVSNEASFCAVPPARIVPILTDEDVVEPASPRLHGCYAHMDKRPAEGAQRHTEPNTRPRPISPAGPARSGVGI